MGKPNYNPATSWQSTDEALGPWFDSKRHFGQLPEEVQARFCRGLMPLLWNQSSSNQRRRLGREWDCQYHPALAHAHEAVWKGMEALNECERTASRVALEDRSITEVLLHKTELRRLQKDLAAAESVLQQTANRIGLGFAPASKPQIIKTVREIYTYAIRNKMCPPDINKLVLFVQEVLRNEGHSASTDPIKAIGNSAEFRKCRAKTGVRNNGSLAPFSLQGWSKSGG